MRYTIYKLAFHYPLFINFNLPTWRKFSLRTEIYFKLMVPVNHEQREVLVLYIAYLN